VGRSTSQAVSRWPLTAESWNRSQAAFMVDKVALGHVLLQAFPFPLPLSFQQCPILNLNNRCYSNAGFHNIGKHTLIKISPLFVKAQNEVLEARAAARLVPFEDKCVMSGLDPVFQYVTLCRWTSTSRRFRRLQPT
jgi:hypothetical protein